MPGASSDRIHPAAAEGFGSAAAAYERGRPDYPPTAIEHLAARLDLRPGATVLDLGAGTGKLTRQLVQTGATVVAIEPVAAMRERLRATVPGVEVIDCTAEQISWPDDDADAVVAGQAFHWFDAPRALIDIHRVLREGGGLGLIWNKRDERVPWVARLGEIMQPYESNEPRHARGDWRAVVAQAELFTDVEATEFAHAQPLDVDGLIDRVASVSFIAIQPGDVRAGIVDEVTALASELPERFELPYVTQVFTCSKR